MDERKNNKVEGFLYNRSLQLPRLPFLAFAYFGPASYIILELLNYGQSCGLVEAAKMVDHAAINATSIQFTYAQCVNSKTGIMIGVVLLVTLHLFLGMADRLRPKRQNYTPSQRHSRNRSRSNDFGDDD